MNCGYECFITVFKNDIYVISFILACRFPRLVLMDPNRNCGKGGTESDCGCINGHHPPLLSSIDSVLGLSTKNLFCHGSKVKSEFHSRVGPRKSRLRYQPRPFC